MMALGVALAGLAGAGPLDPPTGPISPTGKTLTEVEPRIAINSTNTPGDANSVLRITSGGSYYLAADVNGVSGKHGIEIATTAPITIDLNGFNLIGVPGSLKGIGVDTGSSTTSVTVRNGTISGWGSTGVEAVCAEDLRVLSNGGIGISMPAPGHVLRCYVQSNGITAGAYGIVSSGFSTIRECIVRLNGGATGGGGVQAGEACMIEDCVIERNGNAAGSGGAWGVSAGVDCIIRNCRINLNGATAATSSGGALTGAGTDVRGNSLFANRNAGIVSTGECEIRENKIEGSGPGIGILVNAGSMKIADNTILFYNTGIKIGAGISTCTVIRNVVRGATLAYDISAGNDVGPIGTAATATSPFANTQGP